MRIIFLSYLLTFSFILSAQQIVKGKVLASGDGEPLIGAHVYLLNNWRKGATTDIEGKFSFILNDKDLQDSLIVSYVGFNERVVPVQAEMIIKLKELEIAGETVVVTARPLIAEEFKYMEISKIEIYTNPAAMADPILAVNSLPSSTTTDESANISLRGSSPIETGTFLNNVPIYDAVRYSQLNGIGTFSIFSTEIIKDVTVFPGNPPLEFGNATSGIISIQTDDRVLEGSANSLILSLANIGLSRQQKINEKSSLKVFSNWQTSGAIKMLNGEALEDIESFASNDLGIYYYGSSEKIAWKMIGYGITEGYKFKFDHPSYVGTFSQEKQRAFLISSLEYPLKVGTVSLNNGLSFSNGDYSFSNVAFNVKNRDIFGGLNYLLAKEKYSLKAGISYDSRFAAVDGSFHSVGYALGTSHPTTDVKEDLKIVVPESFIYVKYYISDEVAVGGGARKNISVNDVNGYLSRQINLSYQKGDWSVILGSGLYNKHGFLENSGTPFGSVSNQRSLDIKRSKSGFELALSLFDKQGSINGTEYEARGIEAFSDYRINDKLRVSGSIALLDGFDPTYFVRGNVSWNPASSWTIQGIIVSREGTLTRLVEDAGFDSEFTVFEPRYSETDFRLNSYVNVGISVNKIIEISEDIGLIAFASINNVFDRENENGFSYNFDYSQREQSLFSQRTGYFGVVINF